MTVTRINNLSIYPILVIEDEMLEMTGGAVAFTCTEEVQVMAFKSEFDLDLIIGEKMIMIHPNIKTALTEEEFKAVIMHEEGHLFLGHLETNTENELAADAYAAAKVSKAAMLSGLKTLLNGLPKVIGDVILGNEQVAQQLNARYSALTD